MSVGGTKLDAAAAQLAPQLVSALGDEAVLVEAPVAALVPEVNGRRVLTSAEGAAPGDLVLERMPGSRDRSAAAFLLQIGDEVIVPELEQSAFDAIGLVHEVALGRLVQTFLDLQVEQLRPLGVKLARLPMMPAVDLDRDPGRPESWVGSFASPADTLLVEARGAPAAFCPRLDDERFDARYRELAAEQRGRWERFFADRGTAVNFVDVSALAVAGRSLRSLHVAPEAA